MSSKIGKLVRVPLVLKHALSQKAHSSKSLNSLVSKIHEDLSKLYELTQEMGSSPLLSQPLPGRLTMRKIKASKNES